MKANNEDIQKRTYNVPHIRTINLDNEISLALESEPPILPGEDISNAPEYFNNDPFRLIIV